MKSVSVVLPTFNRKARLQQVIHGLESQSYPSAYLEVIVVDDGSTDGTPNYLRTVQTHLRLVTLTQANQGPAAARNLGVRYATGELLLFLDDDVIPAPQLVAAHVAMHDEHGEEVVVMGPMLTPHDFAMQSWVRWEQMMLTKQYDAMTAGEWQPTARQFYTGNASLFRRHLADDNVFDVRFRRAEDVELAYRLADRGLTFLFHPAAAGYHYAERSFAAWCQAPYAYGRNDVIFALEEGQRWLLPTIGREFQERHRYVRRMTYLCLCKRSTTGAAVAALRCIVALSERLGLVKLWRAAYSGLYNLFYYQGMADELGGRAPFFGLLKQAQRPSSGPHTINEF